MAITLKEALSYLPRKAPAAPLPALTPEEEAQLHYADALLESGVVRDFNGQMVELVIPATDATDAVIMHLRQKWEAPDEDGGRWVTGVFPVVGAAGEFAGYRLIFAPVLKG